MTKRNRISALARLAQTSNTFSTNTKANYEHYYDIYAVSQQWRTSGDAGIVFIEYRHTWRRWGIRMKWYKKQTWFTVQLKQTSQTLFHLPLACALRQRYKFILPINKKQYQVKCENELLFNTNISTIWENEVSALLDNLFLFQIWP